MLLKELTIKRLLPHNLSPHVWVLQCDMLIVSYDLGMKLNLRVPFPIM